MSLFNNLNLILEYKSRLHLDHSPLLIKQTSFVKIGPNPFQFHEIWFNNLNFSKIIEDY
jgi:hypothetical protein